MPITTINENSHWFIFQADRLLIMKQNASLKMPEKTFSSLTSSLVRQHKLGLFNNIECYCAEVSKETILPQELSTLPLRQAFEVLERVWFGVAVKAFSVINWDRNNQFCGRCSTPTQHTISTFERICPACGLALYPRISPSVIVLIRKQDQILMARSPHFTPGAYGLIAGFVEIGENLEQTLHREVKEEVNIEIKNIRYFGSQPWPFPDSLMIGFTAEYAGGELRIDNNEIEAAGWYRYDNLPGLPSSSFSLSRKLIDHYLAEYK